MSPDHGFDIRARLGDATPRPRRKRVVLADRRTRQVARTIMELEEQTSVGEVLVRHLVKVQLRSALVLTGVVAGVLLGLPVLFWVVPSIGDFEVLGFRLPWLLLGVLSYPFLVLIGYLCTRSAERHERDFIHMVEQ
ncbi:hypothetical protein AB0I53_00120 [Saccharopolyspora sp. NPDC050389]|uniref:hypothetical protein n=1 Tax=Saccharopolyspora sp. NPDC050389 TaxID=3155516 RepID=UPI0034104C3C